MKHKTMRKPRGITLIEVLVIISVILILLALFPVSFAHAPLKAKRIKCVNNLHEIGTAYRVWAGDNGDLFPAQQTVKNGGCADFFTNANQGALCWTNYAIMQYELGQSPKLVICTSDERRVAADFTNNFKDNSHVSYFVGVNANDLYPQSILGGDRNLGPGPKPNPDYGFSPKSGKGNDVTIPLNSSNSALAWSLKMHSVGNPVGAGNILLGDGSAQQVSSATFNRDWLPNAAGTNNWPAGHIPATPSIRLVFP
jgi:type II secretory pathway pseudopilin PulG